MTTINRMPQFGRYEHSDYEALRIQSIADTIRELCGQHCHDMFDPNSCADSLGIAVRPTKLSKGLSGCLRLDLDPLTIEVQEDESPMRRRFTLSHELAHLCFLRARPKQWNELEAFHCRDIDDREEKLCNRIAGELLMPTTTFKKKVTKYSPSYDGLLDISHWFDVSIGAVVTRINQLRLWSTGRIVWTTEKNDLLRQGLSIQVRPFRKWDDRHRMERHLHRLINETEEVLRKDLSGSKLLMERLGSSHHVSFPIEDTCAIAWKNPHDHQIVGVVLQ